MSIAYTTSLGVFYSGSSEEILASEALKPLIRKVDLIFTSPPFPLNRKKKYGNFKGQEYIDWLASFASLFKRLLRPKGSIVIEMGNSWEPGEPVMSTLALRGLLAFLDKSGLHLCQQFIHHNPAKLPTPAQWVNVERIRVKDSYTHLWWMSKTTRPKADNRRILKEYSDSMKHLLSSGRYNAGRRPSEHKVGESSFLQNNKGAIPSNVITAANTRPNSGYISYCRQRGLQIHPARMPIEIPEFFVKFLTLPGNLVLDPFAGSNTTGEAAEKLKRRWVSIEAIDEYIKGSVGRFADQA